MKPRVLIRHENMGFRADYVHTRVCVCMSVYFLVIDSVSHVGHTYMHISQHRARFFFYTQFLYKTTLLVHYILSRKSSSPPCDESRYESEREHEHVETQSHEESSLESHTGETAALRYETERSDNSKSKSHRETHNNLDALTVIIGHDVQIISVPVVLRIELLLQRTEKQFIVSAAHQV